MSTDSKFIASIGLMQALEVLAKLEKHVPVAFGILGDTGWTKIATESFSQGFGLTQEQFRNRDFLKDVIDSDKQAVITWLQESPSAEPSSMNVQIKDAEGVPRYLEAWIAKIPPETDSQLRRLAIFRDIDGQVRAAQVANAAKAEAQGELDTISKALNVSRDGFAIWDAQRDPQGNINNYLLKFINYVGAAPTKKSAKELIGLPIGEALEGSQGAHLSELFTKALTTGQEVVDVVEVNSEIGWSGAYENRVVPLSSDSVVTSFRDISEQRKEETRLNWLIDHDHLTGLASKPALEKQLERALEKSRASKKPFVFAFIDIDGFKKINDAHGHEAGDLVLKQFSEKLIAAAGKESFSARISGDEFGLIIEGLDNVEIAREGVKKIHAALQGLFNAGATVSVGVTCSAGAAHVTNFTSGASEIMRFADRAMYAVKLNGRANFELIQL